MKTRVLVFVAGLLIGELDPFGWAAWRLIETRLPGIKADSLAAPSAFESIAPASWIAETPNAFAIENPYESIAPVHLLVIAKRRYTSVLEAPPEVLGEMLALGRRAAAERGIAERGFRFVINTNPEGTQTVYHVHMHVLGGEQLTWPLLPLIWNGLGRLAG